jgi:hypothetical protein
MLYDTHRMHPIDETPVTITTKFPLAPVSASIGDDINLPLLVRELGGRKLATLNKRKEALLTELERVQHEMQQLEVLVTAAQSLT